MDAWNILNGLAVAFLIPMAAVVINAIGDLWFKVQGTRQQQQQAHSITIEESHSGGYQVVE